jgi:hypothetical protein
MGRPWPTAALPFAAVVLTVAVVVPVGSGVAAVRQPSTVPSRLVGKWTRKVTSADVKRAGGLVLMAGHVFTLTITKSGTWTVSCAGLGGLCTADGKIIPAGTNRVHINTSDATGNPNLYGWRISGRLLTLTKLKDPVPDRVQVMWGVWKRK